MVQKGMGALNHFQVKNQLFSYIAQGGKVIIIDPENEYTKMVEALGGQSIKVSGEKVL